MLDDKAVEVTPSSSDFWIIVRALKVFKACFCESLCAWQELFAS